MDVTKSLSRLRGFLIFLDVGKLVVGQVEADHGHGLLYTSLVFFLHFWIHIWGWNLIGSIDNVPKIHGGREHFNLKLPKVEPFSMELINGFDTLALKKNHLSNVFTRIPLYSRMV
jgi:hypothetical protein